MSITLEAARDLAGRLRARGVRFTAGEVQGWPIGRFRVAKLWCRVRDHARAYGRPAPDLGPFLDGRKSLRRCRVCGCTEDNACVDPGMEFACSWVGPDLCSACVGRAGRTEAS